MDYPGAYIDYLIHFHGDRDWFECHEILEEYWKKEGMKDQAWVCLIQIAVGLYHERRRNMNGAKKMLCSALDRMVMSEIRSLGLDAIKLRNLLRERIEQLDGGTPFLDFNLPIADPLLLKACIQGCERNHFVWLGVSRMEDEQLLHKHTLRDRSQVVKEREARLKKGTGN